MNNVVIANQQKMYSDIFVHVEWRVFVDMSTRAFTHSFGTFHFYIGASQHSITVIIDLEYLFPKSSL